MFIQALTVPVPAEIQSRYDTTQATVTWVVTAYLLTTSVTTPITGRVGDVIGKNRALVFCLAAITVGSAIAMFAPTIGWLITARVIQGVGGGAVPLAYGILRDESAGDLLTRRIGRLASVTALGYAGGIVLASDIQANRRERMPCGQSVAVAWFDEVAGSRFGMLTWHPSGEWARWVGFGVGEPGPRAHGA